MTRKLPRQSAISSTSAPMIGRADAARGHQPDMAGAFAQLIADHLTDLVGAIGDARLEIDATGSAVAVGLRSFPRARAASGAICQLLAPAGLRCPGASCL